MERMAHFVWIVGTLIAVWGVTALFRPDWMKKIITFVSKGKLVYFIAGIKIIIGIIFLVLATNCKLPPVIIVIGILSAGGATLFCMLPFSKITAYMEWWKKRPLWIYRVWGVAAAIFGGLLMYAGVPK